jgi:hypothetical protein
VLPALLSLHPPVPVSVPVPVRALHGTRVSAMGIAGLSAVLADHAPRAVRENEIRNFFGRIVAIDASMSIYQFLIAVRSDGQNLTNEAGETTSHLMGMFYRTIRMVENGIKPVYVFDGKPPALKSGEVQRRTLCLCVCVCVCEGGEKEEAAQGQIERCSVCVCVCVCGVHALECLLDRKLPAPLFTHPHTQP